MRYYITDIVFSPVLGYRPNIPDRIGQKWDVLSGLETDAAGVPVDTFVLVSVQQFIRPIDVLVEVDTDFDLIDGIASNFKFPLDIDNAVDNAFKGKIVSRVGPYILDLSGETTSRDCIRKVGRLLNPTFDTNLLKAGY